VFVLALHHIVCDEWSIGVLLEELAAHYAAGVAGRAAALPEPPVQYADFAVWQRAWLQGERLAAQLAYWQRQLAGAPPAWPCPPTTAPGAAVLPQRPAQRLPAQLTAALKTMSQREGPHRS
jgi:hypothetical protein